MLQTTRRDEPYVRCRVGKENLLDEIHDDPIVVLHVIPVEVLAEPREEKIPVDGCKERGDIEFEAPRLLIPVVSGRCHEVTHPLYGEVRTLPHPRGIYVVDEPLFKKRIDGIDDKMVYDSVSEGCGEDLPDGGVINNEAVVRLRLIAVAVDFIKKPEEITFKINFEGEGTGRRTLMFTAVIVGFEDLTYSNRLIDEKIKLPVHYIPP